MATNAASHNPMGAKTGPATGPPPPLQDEVKSALTGAAENEATGHHTSGQDAGSKVGTAEAVIGEKEKKDKDTGSGGAM